jgi:hypothetical protein
MNRTVSLWLLVCGWFLIAVKPVLAAPYYQVTGPSLVYPNLEWEYSLWIHPNGTTITAGQAQVHYDTSKLDAAALDTTGTTCSFWSPADPSLGLGNQATPYFTNGTLLVSCGFAAPGRSSSGLITKFRLQPKSNLSSDSTSSISIDNLRFLYKSTALLPGTSPSFSFTVYESSSSAFPSPTPINITTLTENDLTFVDITTSLTSTGQSSNLSVTGSSGTSTASSSQSQLARDDSIPPPPANLEPRMPVTPFQLPPTPSTDDLDDEGEVLSISTLKELLIPGKSDADKTVVLFNIVMTLTFLILLAILLWRLLVNSRMNKIKYQHMQELITGELSMIESKITGDSELKTDLANSLEELREELDET